MNFFDFEIITYLNQFSQQSKIFDSFMLILSGNSLLKASIFMFVLWYGWFKDENNRQQIISILISSIIAMLFARGLALTLPFRLRPLHEKGLDFVLPHGMVALHSSGWSSMPSDHAVLFFSLATGIFFISKKLGLFTFFYTVLFIAIPRVYLGLHYPTDIILGAIVGIIIAVLGQIYFNKNKYIGSIVVWSNSKPHIFYPLFFLVTYQFTDMFNSSRDLARIVFKFLFD